MLDTAAKSDRDLLVHLVTRAEESDKKLEKIDRTLHGNGRPGLVSIVDTTREKIEAAEEDVRSLFEKSDTTTKLATTAATKADAALASRKSHSLPPKSKPVSGVKAAIVIAIGGVVGALISAASCSPVLP